MALLDGLEEVPWETLSGCYGPATDVPENIRTLASTDEATWQAAFDNLVSAIWHQGTVYGATAETVPFLVELLDSEAVLHRDGILYLLSMIADGHSYFDVHDDLDPEWADQYLAEQGTDIESQLQKELGYVRASRENVLRYADVYKRLLRHEEPALVGHAAFLLSGFSELSGQLFALFKQLYREDERQGVRSSFLHAIRELDADREEMRLFFESTYDREEGDELRSVAALGAFAAAGSACREDIFSYLLDFYAYLKQETEFGHLPEGPHHDPWVPPFL